MAPPAAVRWRCCRCWASWAVPHVRYAPNSAQAVHYFAEAGRLAFADRDFYVADPDFVKVPVRALLDPAYLRGRAR